jgi:TonB family protein
MSLDEPAPDNAATTSASSAANTDLPANVLESNEPDAPAVNTTETKKTTNTNNSINTNTRNRSDRPANSNNTQQKARYVYGGSTGTGGNNATTDAKGNSEGNTTGNGDRGVPGGTPGADNYEGTPGSGGGISHNISGRNIVAFPPREAEFKEGGTVTVRITVNRAGTITDKRIVSSSSPQLRELALKKVNSIRFNKSDSAPEEQFGNITFVFKTRS